MSNDEENNLWLESGEAAGLKHVIRWFLDHYEGMEHLTECGDVSPETWYTATTILRRCLDRIDAKAK